MARNTSIKNIFKFKHLIKSLSKNWTGRPIQAAPDFWNIKAQVSFLFHFFLFYHFSEFNYFNWKF